jgi:hypothetical protein
MNFEAALGLLTIELDLQFDQENVGLRCSNPTYHGLSDRPPLGMKMVSGWSKTKESSLKRGRSRLEA